MQVVSGATSGRVRNSGGPVIMFQVPKFLDSGAFKFKAAPLTQIRLFSMEERKRPANASAAVIKGDSRISHGHYDRSARPVPIGVTDRRYALAARAP